MSNSSVTKPGDSLQEFKVPTGIVNLNEISQMLIEQMKEVKTNPAAIPQAECAAMLAGKIIDIAKTQVAQVAAVNDLVRTKNGVY